MSEKKSPSEVKKSPILITGAARSGTSMIAGIIDICGAFGGITSPANQYNAKGMFENVKIRDIDREYLTMIGADPMGQSPLPEQHKILIPADWKDRVDKAIIEDGYPGGPWYYKGARSCMIWKVWHHAYPDAKWVIVRRRTADIVESCMKTGFMSAYDNEQDWIKWVHYHEDRFIEMIRAGLNVKIVWPERVVKGNYEQLAELIEWLGLSLKLSEIIKFIEPKIWKARKKSGMS